MEPIVQLIFVLVLLGTAAWAARRLELPTPLYVGAMVQLTIVGLVWVARAFGVRMPW